MGAATPTESFCARGRLCQARVRRRTHTPVCACAPRCARVSRMIVLFLFTVPNLVDAGSMPDKPPTSVKQVKRSSPKHLWPTDVQADDSSGHGRQLWERCDATGCCDVGYHVCSGSVYCYEDGCRGGSEWFSCTCTDCCTCGEVDRCDFSNSCGDSCCATNSDGQCPSPPPPPPPKPPPSPSPPLPPPSPPFNGDAIGGAVGGAIGGVLVLAIIGYFVWRRFAQNKAKTSPATSDRAYGSNTVRDTADPTSSR